MYNVQNLVLYVVAYLFGTNANLNAKRKLAAVNSLPVYQGLTHQFVSFAEYRMRNILNKKTLDLN